MPIHDKTTNQIFNSRSFGISNGVITILAILAGFIATKASKIVILGTLLALLITDPLVDSYSVYVSMKEHDEKLALKKFQESLIFQVLVQLGFFIIMLVSPTPLLGFIICCVVGLGIIVYDYYSTYKKTKKTLIEISKIIGLIVFTFIVDKIAFYFNEKNNNKSLQSNIVNNSRNNVLNNN